MTRSDSVESRQLATRQSHTITRADLAESVYQKVGLSRAESADLVEIVLRE
ncbi:MAG TPA: integration host factor subunit alpha, partial [Beijerinckiaceae bacterium]|nr:integration host factor subunit alpha [Beijerinckiaceae bacterium]